MVNILKKVAQKLHLTKSSDKEDKKHKNGGRSQSERRPNTSYSPPRRGVWEDDPQPSQTRKEFKNPPVSAQRFHSLRDPLSESETGRTRTNLPITKRRQWSFEFSRSQESLKLKGDNTQRWSHTPRDAKDPNKKKFTRSRVGSDVIKEPSSAAVARAKEEALIELVSSARSASKRQEAARALSVLRAKKREDERTLSMSRAKRREDEEAAAARATAERMARLREEWRREEEYATRTRPRDPDSGEGGSSGFWSK